MSVVNEEAEAIAQSAIESDAVAGDSPANPEPASTQGETACASGSDSEAALESPTSEPTAEVEAAPASQPPRDAQIEPVARAEESPADLDELADGLAEAEAALGEVLDEMPSDSVCEVAVEGDACSAESKAAPDASEDISGGDPSAGPEEASVPCDERDAEPRREVGEEGGGRSDALPGHEPSSRVYDAEWAVGAVGEIDAGIRRLAELLGGEVRSQWEQASESLREIARSREGAEAANVEARSLLVELRALREEVKAASGEMRTMCEEARADREAARLAKTRAETSADIAEKLTDQIRSEQPACPM